MIQESYVGQVVKSLLMIAGEHAIRIQQYSTLIAFVVA